MKESHAITEQEAQRVKKGRGATVVAAVDESKFADLVFEFVARHFNSDDIKVVFLYVAKAADGAVKPPRLVMPSKGIHEYGPQRPVKPVLFSVSFTRRQPAPFKSYSQDVTQANSKRSTVDTWAKKAADLKVKAQCEGCVLVGDAREETKRFCDVLKPDALVMGSHGKGALGRMMLGSVSDYCVHQCHCPVIIVRPDEAKDASRGFHFPKWPLSRSADAKPEAPAKPPPEAQAA